MKKIILPETLTKYDFSKLAKKESNGRKKLRLLGMHHLQCGNTLKATGLALGVTSRTVSNWLSNFKSQGLGGLSDKAHTGRNGYLNKIDSNELRMEIEALQESRQGGRIRGIDVIEHLYSKYSINYHKNSIYRVLKKLGLVWITVRSKHPNSDIEKQEAFKKTLKKIS
jgi:transposase